MFKYRIKKDRTDGIVLLLHKSVLQLHWKHGMQDACKYNQTEMFPKKLNGNDHDLKPILLSAGRLKTLNICFNMNEQDRGTQLMVW